MTEKEKKDAAFIAKIKTITIGTGAKPDCTEYEVGCGPVFCQHGKPWGIAVGIREKKQQQPNKNEEQSFAA